MLYGDYNRTRVDLSGDVPVSPGVFALRAAIAIDRRDGYTDNAFTGREEDDADSKFAKLAAVISPNERVAITLRGTLGIRWTKDEKKDRQTVQNNIGGDFCENLALEDEWDELTGKAGLDMDIGENTLLYGTISTGFKAGGFNGGQCNNQFEPETLMAWEAAPSRAC